jgi:hypothetical protein
VNISFPKSSLYQHKKKHAKVLVQLNFVWYSHLIISNFKPHTLNLSPMEDLKQKTWIQITNFQQWRLPHSPPTHVAPHHPPPKQQHNKGLIYFFVFYFSHLSMTNLNATNGGFQSKLCNRRKPKTPQQSLPLMRPSFASLLLRDQKY